MNLNYLKKIKTIEDLDLGRYDFDVKEENPYIQRFAPKRKSIFSTVVLLDEVKGL